MILELTPFEKARRDEVLKAEGHDYLADLEETCEGSASYHYEVHTSNIGDSLYLVYKGKKTFLSDPESF